MVCVGSHSPNQISFIHWFQFNDTLCWHTRRALGVCCRCFHAKCTRLTHKRTRRMWQNNTNNTFIPCITPVVTKYTRWINRLLNSIPSHKAHQTIRFLNIPTDGRRIIFYFKLNSLNLDIFVFESHFFMHSIEFHWNASDPNFVTQRNNNVRLFPTDIFDDGFSCNWKCLLVYCEFAWNVLLLYWFRWTVIIWERLITFRICSFRKIF